MITAGTSTGRIEARLAASYATCRDLHRRHGTTYYYAARILPPDRRRHVHALYGFCRYADEIVDDLNGATVEQREAQLWQLHAQFRSGLEAGGSDHEVLGALIDTVLTLRIEPECIERFIRSMAMDLTVTSYATYGDLEDYMDGSAAVIGEMMLPVLDPAHRPSAVAPARALGMAFQLTNFIRDVGEDLERGRVYLPVEDLERFGADPLQRRVSPEWVHLLRFEIARTRSLYEKADAGIAVLPPRGAACVRAARILYDRILDRVVENGYDVFSARARVTTGSKVLTTARCLAGTIGTRNP